MSINSTGRYKVLKKRGKGLAVANSRLFFLKDCALMYYPLGRQMSIPILKSFNLNYYSSPTLKLFNLETLLWRL